MEDLLNKVRNRRIGLQRYIRTEEPKNKRLLNIAIVCGILATLLTGIPALGGEKAIKQIKSQTNPVIPVWQIMCIGASVCTSIATAATSYKNSHDTSNKIAKAQVCDSKLEMLELLLETRQIENKQAIEKYGEYVSEVSFVPNAAVH